MARFNPQLTKQKRQLTRSRRFPTTKRVLKPTPVPTRRTYTQEELRIAGIEAARAERSLDRARQGLESQRAKVQRRETEGKEASSQRTRLAEEQASYNAILGRVEANRAGLGNLYDTAIRLDTGREQKVGSGTVIQETERPGRAVPQSSFANIRSLVSGTVAASEKITTREQQAIMGGANFQTQTGEFFTASTSSPVKPIQLPTSGANPLLDKLAVSGVLGTGFAASRIGFSQDPLPPDPTKVRPQYSSAIGYSTAQGTVELLSRFPEKSSNVRKSTPTFAQQRQRDIFRFQKAGEEGVGGDGRELFRAFSLPVIEQFGLGIEKASLEARKRLPARYETTPVPFFTDIGVGLGRFARTQPEQVINEALFTLAVGGGIGYLGGRALTRVAAKKGLQTAFNYERALNVGGAGLFGASIFGIGSVGGGEAVGRALPGFVGFGVGFSTGFRKAGGGVRFNVLQGSRTGEPLVNVRNNLLVSRSSGGGVAEGVAFGQPFSAPVKINARFVGRRLEGTDVFRGVGRVKSSLELSGRTFTQREFFSGAADVGKGIFAGRLPSGEFVSVAGGSVVEGVGESIRPTSSFLVRGGKVVEARQGAIVSESFESPIIRFSPRVERAIVDTPLLTATERIPAVFGRVGTEQIGLGTSRDTGVLPVLGRGSRGRLARGLGLLGRAEGTETTVAFKRIFPTESPLVVPTIGFGLPRSRRGQLSVLKSQTQEVINKPFEITQPEFLRPVRPLDIGSVPIKGFRSSPSFFAGVQFAPTTTTKLGSRELTKPVSRQTPLGRVDSLFTPVEITTPARVTTPRLLQTPDSFIPQETVGKVRGVPPLLTPTSSVLPAGGLGFPLFPALGGGRGKGKTRKGVKKRARPSRTLPEVLFNLGGSVAKVPKGGFTGLELTRSLAPKKKRKKSKKRKKKRKSKKRTTKAKRKKKR